MIFFINAILIFSSYVNVCSVMGVAFRFSLFGFSLWLRVSCFSEFSISVCIVMSC